jgi:hypothetical protein
VEHEGLAKEEVFESEAGSNSPEIKEIPVLAVVFKCDYIRRWSSQCVLTEIY